MNEDELTELDKIFMDAMLTTWKEDEQEYAKKYLLEDLEKGGHIKEITTREVWNKTWTVFRFQNGNGEYSKFCPFLLPRHWGAPLDKYYKNVLHLNCGRTPDRLG